MSRSESQKKASRAYASRRKKQLANITPQPQGEDPTDMGEDLKRGRPTKYREWYGHRVYEYRLLGANYREICTMLQISSDTLNRWIKEHPHFSKRYQEGGDLAQAKVAAALHHTACGYSHEAVHISSHQGVVTQTKYTKRYPPDVSAAKMVLYNKHSGNWKPMDSQSRMQQPADESAGNHGPAPNIVVLLDDQNTASAMLKAFQDIEKKRQSKSG